MSKFPKDTPKAILRAAHKQKMQGKHFRRMESGVTRMSRKVAELKAWCVKRFGAAKAGRALQLHMSNQRDVVVQSKLTQLKKEK